MKTFFLVAPVLLSACATVPQSDPPVRPGQPPVQTCSNANLQQFVGQATTQDLGAEMMRVSGATSIRWAASGTAVTMEFRYGRLTVFLDPQNRVERVSCS